MEKNSAATRAKPTTEERKKYEKPALKRYVAPKIQKHASYKDITMLFASIPVVPSPSP